MRIKSRLCASGRASDSLCQESISRIAYLGKLGWHVHHRQQSVISPTSIVLPLPKLRNFSLFVQQKLFFQEELCTVCFAMQSM